MLSLEGTLFKSRQLSVKGVWVTVGLSWNNNYSTNIYTDIYCGLVSRTVVLLAAAGMPCLVLRLLLGSPQWC
jgi:hypothetical protein